ncbi:SAV_915 family protein [Streptomyces sp. NPDC020917]|uniref:SAV_915 family protein n=1 Tax=Streptomyces sp. NPDC020917 TaxID=3365102 RepID=UPI0037A28C8C
MFRTPLGGRTAVGFTTHRRMTDVLGRDQACTRLSVPALRALAEPLGVTTLTVDPQLAAPPVRHDGTPATKPQPAPAPAPEPVPAPPAPSAPASEPSARTSWDPQMVGVMRVTAMAAAVEALTLWIG